MQSDDVKLLVHTLLKMSRPGKLHIFSPVSSFQSEQRTRGVETEDKLETQNFSNSTHNNHNNPKVSVIFLDL